LLDIYICRDILAYIIVPLIQKKADIFIKMWNTHRIRSQKLHCCLMVYPIIYIYTFPEKYDLQEQGENSLL